MRPSATLAINEDSKRLIAEGRVVTRFGLGQSPFPVPEVVVEALRSHAHEKDYLHVAGLPALREAVASWYERGGLRTRANEIFVGPGSKELLFTVQLVCDAELLVPSPCWVSYAPQARIAGRPCTLLPTSFSGRWRLTPEVLDRHCSTRHRARLLILNYPGNPDGLSYTPAELRALTEVLRRHRVLVVSDEIYGPMAHDGDHRSLAEFYPEGTLVSGGLSKWCGAGGWRVGTLRVPQELSWIHRAMSVVASETFSAVSAPTQYAAVTAFNEDLTGFLERQRAVLRWLVPRCTGPLRSAGVQIHEPTGAFYFVGLIPGGGDAGAFCEELLEGAGVAVLPGADFMRPAGELSFRLAYVDFDGAAALAEGADLEEVCAPTLDGIRRMAEFVARFSPKHSG
ncbi:MAG TPA: aminotransferase class I/II-fold pyridoxal phosphate-dependent enzyme [Myxococcota bacterium]|nr:aminotransferase class I/II-fold pyridoxal phosphate-dependent enzyme [Myxococcota bacterium]